MQNPESFTIFFAKLGNNKLLCCYLEVIASSRPKETLNTEILRDHSVSTKE